MDRKQIAEVADEVLKGTTRSHVAAARTLAEAITTGPIFKIVEAARRLIGTNHAVSRGQPERDPDFRSWVDSKRLIALRDAFGFEEAVATKRCPECIYTDGLLAVPCEPHRAPVGPSPDFFCTECDVSDIEPHEHGRRASEDQADQQKLAKARGMLVSAQGVIAGELPADDCTSEDIQRVLDETAGSRTPDDQTCNGLGLCVKRGPFGAGVAGFCDGAGRCMKGLATAEASTPAYEHSAGCLASSSNQWQCPVRGCQMLPDEALPASEAWNAPRRDSVCGVDGCRAKLCKHARERLTELLIERDNALATTDRAALIDLATRGVVRFPGASPRETAASLRSRPEERTGAADGSTYYCLVDKEQVWLCGHAECECTCGEDYMTQAEECTWCVAQEDARMGLHETASPFGRCPHCGNSTWLDGKCTGPCTASASPYRCAGCAGSVDGPDGRIINVRVCSDACEARVRSRASASVSDDAASLRDALLAVESEVLGGRMGGSVRRIVDIIERVLGGPSDPRRSLAGHTCPRGTPGFFPNCTACVRDMEAGAKKGECRVDANSAQTTGVRDGTYPASDGARDILTGERASSNASPDWDAKAQVLADCLTDDEPNRVAVAKKGLIHAYEIGRRVRETGAASVGHTCDPDGGGIYDLRCSGCVATRIAMVGPILEVGSGHHIAGIVAWLRSLPAMQAPAALADEIERTWRPTPCASEEQPREERSQPCGESSSSPSGTGTTQSGAGSTRACATRTRATR